MKGQSQWVSGCFIGATLIAAERCLSELWLNRDGQHRYSEANVPLRPARPTIQRVPPDQLTRGLRSSRLPQLQEHTNNQGASVVRRALWANTRQHLFICSCVWWSSLRSISSRRCRIGERLSSSEVMTEEEAPSPGWGRVRMGPKWQSRLNSAFVALRVEMGSKSL